MRAAAAERRKVALLKSRNEGLAAAEVEAAEAKWERVGAEDELQPSIDS